MSTSANATRLPAALLRGALSTVLVLALLLALFAEFVLWMPVAWWYWAGVVALFSLLVVRSVRWEQQRGRLIATVVFTTAVAVVWAGDWSSRKSFLRDFDRIEVGMTEDEVRELMDGYQVGTGWRLPGPRADERIELQIDGALVFRHSDDGRFNSDWGIVRLELGRVIATEFSPD